MASLRTLQALAAPKRSVKQGGVIGSEAERKRRDEALKEAKLAELTQKKGEAEAFLSQGQFEHSIPVALEAMQLSVELFGKESIDVVPCYLLLAEANLGTQELGQAEWYLSQANWAVVKTPDCSFHIRSIVHRCFGKLYAQQGRTEEALTHLSSNVYYCARESGPLSIDCADGYFLLAQVFYMSLPDEGFWLKQEHKGQFVQLPAGGLDAVAEECALTLAGGGYGRADIKFALDEDGCLVHLATGMYVQPLSRAAKPAASSPLVLRRDRVPAARGQDPPVLHSFSFVDGVLRHGPSGRAVVSAQAMGGAEDNIQLVLRETDDAKQTLARWAPDGKQSALSLFGKVLQIWSELMGGPEGVDAALGGSATLSDVVIDEAGRMVERVLEVMVAEKGEGAAEVALCRFTMGLIYHYLGANTNALESYGLARGIAEALEDTAMVTSIDARKAQLA
jgi:hypothetical protein